MSQPKEQPTNEYAGVTDPRSGGTERSMLPPKHFVAVDDIAASVRGPDVRYARRFSLDVAEDALAKMGPVAVEWVTQKLADRIQHEQRGEVERVVQEYLRNREWAEPIIRAAIQEAVREVIIGMLGNTKLAEALGHDQEQNP